MRRPAAPDLLSIARVPAALVLIWLYPNQVDWRFWTTVALVAFVFLSDFLDGKIARASATASPLGYVIDGWTDRAFHIAVYLILLDTSVLPLALVWLLLFREVSVYVVRTVDPSWHADQTRLERTLNVAFTVTVRVILVASLTVVATTRDGWFRALHSSAAVALTLCALLSVYQLGRRLFQVWNRALS